MCSVVVLILIGILAVPRCCGREENCRVVWIKNLSAQAQKPTPEVAPLFRTSNDDIDSGTSGLPRSILRALRVARNELVYTGWVMNEKNPMRVGKAPTTANAEVERDVDESVWSGHVLRNKISAESLRMIGWTILRRTTPLRIDFCYRNISFLIQRDTIKARQPC